VLDEGLRLPGLPFRLARGGGAVQWRGPDLGEANAALYAAAGQSAALPSLAPMLEQVTPAVVNIYSRQVVRVRNPLAEPSVLGASNSAALGAVCALYFGLSALHPLVLPLLAITTALVAIAGLFLLAGPSESPLTLILAGIAVATLAGAGISLSLNLSPNPFAAMEIMTWLMGSLENRSYVHVLVALPCIAIGAALLLADGRTLDALTLGEEGAQALGVNLNAARLRMMLGVAIGVGGAVAVSGAIGFVGLIVPHIVRPLVNFILIVGRAMRWVILAYFHFLAICIQNHLLDEIPALGVDRMRHIHMQFASLLIPRLRNPRTDTIHPPPAFVAKP